MARRDKKIRNRRPRRRRLASDLSKRRGRTNPRRKWDDGLPAPRCKDRPALKSVKIVIIPVLLADIAKLWGSWYGPALSSAQDAAVSELARIEERGESDDRWNRANYRKKQVALSQKERTDLIQKVFADRNATFLLGLPPGQIDTLRQKGIDLNDGRLKADEYLRIPAGKKFGPGDVSSDDLKKDLQGIFKTPANARYVILPVGKPLEDPPLSMTFPSLPRSKILAGISKFLSDYLGTSRTNVVAVVDTPDSRYDIKLFSRELKKRFVLDRVEMTGLSEKKAMCQLITLGGYVGLSPGEAQKRFRPGPYLDQFLNQKVAEIICEIGYLSDDIVQREFKSSELRSIVKKTRAANQIFSLEALEEYVDALQLEDRVSIETSNDIKQDSKDFIGYVNYDFLTTEEKGAKSAFYAYAQEHMPGMPQVICTFDATRLDDGANVDVLLATLWPAIRKKPMLGLRIAVVSGQMPFNQVGDAASDWAAEHAGRAMEDAEAIRNSIAENLRGEVGALKTLISRVDSLAYGTESPITFAFVTQIGSGNIPLDILESGGRDKSFFLGYRDHQMGRGERTWVLDSLTETTAKVVSAGGHVQDRALYHIVKQSDVESGIPWLLKANQWPKMTLLAEKEADNYTKNLKVELSGLSKKLENPAKLKPYRVEEYERREKDLTDRLAKREETTKALEQAFGQYSAFSQQIVYLYGSSRPKSDPRRAQARDVGAEIRSTGSTASGKSPTTVAIPRTFRASRMGSLHKLIALLRMDPNQHFSRVSNTARRAKQKQLVEKLTRGSESTRAEILKQSQIPVSELKPSRRRHPGYVDADDERREDMISQLNPRHSMSRRSRKPRRHRNNPSDAYKRFVQDYLDPDKQVGADVPMPEAGEILDYSQTPSAFPRRVLSKDSFSLQALARQLADVDGSMVRFINRKSDKGLNFQDLKGEAGEAMALQEGLSLSEARGLSRRYRDAAMTRRTTTIPASSALCAANRRPKLRQYEIPRAVYDFPSVPLRDSKVFIWVSPVSAPTARVMTLRRNTHIDCDFVAYRGLEGAGVGGLLALAIQDTLMWLAQKPGRQKNTTLYIGRVGEKKVRTAWQPGQQLSYRAVIESLANPNVGVLSDYDGENDEDAYLLASNELATRQSESRSAGTDTSDFEDEEDGDVVDDDDFFTEE